MIYLYQRALNCHTFNTEPSVPFFKLLSIHQPWLKLSCVDLQECTKNSLALAASLYACEECLCADNLVHPLPGKELMQDRGIKGGRAKAYRSCAGKMI